jgi:hypothetical protein
MNLVKKTLLVILLLISQLSYGQNLIGYYKNIIKVEGLGFVTRIKLKSDNTFEYHFSGDLFHDSAIGTYSINGNLISLDYETPDYIILEKSDSVNQRIPNISAFVRPIELEMRIRKLIILKRLNSQHENIKQPMKLKRIKAKDWNNSGVTSLKFIAK